MKVPSYFAAALAVAALAGCNKSNSSQGDETAKRDSSTVTITQRTPPPGGTWADVVNQTSAGYLMGNPDAPVKLVEIGSLSCPHCRVFEEEGAPTLVDKYVKTGKVSWEFRPYVIHGVIDMATNLILRCGDPKRFFPLSEAMYKDQENFLNKIQAVPQAQVEQVQNLPPNQVFVEFAKLMGLQDWAAARGIPQAKSNQCLSDQKMIDREVQLTSDVTEVYPDFPGTPAFIIDGKLLANTAAWDKLQPQLDAAVK